MGDLLASTSFEVLFEATALRGVLRYREATLLAYPGNALIPLCSVALGLTILYYERIPRSYRIIGVLLGLVPPIVVSLLQAGRNGIVFQIVLLSWWLLQRPSWGLPILPRGISVRPALLVFVAASLSLIVTISVARSLVVQPVRVIAFLFCLICASERSGLG